MTPEVTQRLKEINVDVKTVTVPKLMTSQCRSAETRRLIYDLVLTTTKLQLLLVDKRFHSPVKTDIKGGEWGLDSQ
jgi:hypothetical protein